jgi:oxygen-independent coproporphyrinogen-3 oxidase
MRPLGLYISVPFCRSKCTYCNFASGVFPATYMERYIHRLTEDLEAAGVHTSAKVLDSIYLGGGTPSLLPPHLIRKLFSAIRQRFEISRDAEITIECAPGQLADDALETMVACGMNRISFGVQSFVNQEAKATGRLHTRAIALNDIHRVRQAGTASINVDLIAGLPHQTEASWRESIDVLIETGINHASIYMLEVDDGSRLGKEVLNGGARYFAPAIPSDDLIAEMYLIAVERLAASGLQQYEISNFARTGAESIHNKKYWLRSPYLGLGVDAHSMLRAVDGTAVRFATTDNLEDYLQSPGWDDRHALSRQEELEEAWFLGLRLNAGVSLKALKAGFGAEAIAGFRPTLDALAEDGLVQQSGDTIQLTQKGRLLSNDVFEHFLFPAVAA